MTPPTGRRGSVPPDVRAARRKTTLVVFGALGGVAAFAAFVASQVSFDTIDADRSATPREQAFLGAAAALVVASSLVGRRMYADDLDHAARVAGAVKYGVASVACSEAAALLGLAGVLLERSWDGWLTAALGVLALLLAPVRFSVAFDRIARDARDGAFEPPSARP
ncbi:MAG TPA: hypothetical protein VEI02_12715 [Planctomycetota bacterium]|nr:hypothetical protein [Planctomycetota bacterium]